MEALFDPRSGVSERIEYHRARGEEEAQERRERS